MFLDVTKVLTLYHHKDILCSFDPGKRRYDRKQEGYGGQTKPVFKKKAKTTKKIVLRMECTTCKKKKQIPLKRCKHFELGGDKKRKVKSAENYVVCPHTCFYKFVYIHSHTTGTNDYILVMKTMFVIVNLCGMILIKHTFCVHG